MNIKTFGNILGAFIFIKSLQLTIVYFSPLQFDTSSSILLDEYQNDLHELPTWLQLICTQLLQKLVVWDSVYFSKLAISNITFEHEWVFGPLWWRLISYFNLQNFYWNLILSVVLSNLFHFLSCLIMYPLTFQFFQWEKKSIDVAQLATVCSLLTVVQPSGIFSTTNYSESASQFFCFLGLYLRKVAFNRGKLQNRLTYLFSGTCFAIAFGFRANCLLYGIVFLVDLCHYKLKYPLPSIMSILAGSQIFAALVYSIWLPYSIYCPERGEWCESVTKSLTSYAQGHYWNYYFTIDCLFQ
ncbi:unnamed protein product [Ambrosiozyma monospora]|uniref:Unnamed protein product n=1 Tax=Ambrosiozyma monospora TaxID=43982 RepID=A0ACB5T0Y9_AMBMO|nr:unnamed protein product [Ambrosiozyma monospora]